MKFSALFPVIVAAVAAASEEQSIARPRIIVAISVDEFSADLFTEYRPLFKAGLHRLQTGVVFPAGYQSHAATETCPGHSTILTGSRPARTGIIANEWYDQSLGRADKKVYCSEDPSLPGSSSTNFTVSAQFLKAQTLGDRLKSAGPGSRVVSVAGKDRAAIMMGGHAMDQVWFWSGKSFVTLKGMDQPTPAIVDQVNASIAVGVMKPDLPVLPEPGRVGAVPAALDATHQPYVVVLTADHGGHDLPERNKIHGFPDATRVDAALLPANMSRQLAAAFNLPEPVLLGVAPFGDIYLARGIPGNVRSRVLEAAKARYLAHPQVAAVFTPAELRRLPLPSGPADEWSLADRFRASFDPERSGDLMVAPKPHITPIIDVSTYVATHGSPWNYDRKVPILFYRPGVAGFEQSLPLQTGDIC